MTADMFTTIHILEGKPNNNCETWWWKCYNLGLLCCFRDWTAHSYQFNYTFYIISKYAWWDVRPFAQKWKFNWKLGFQHDNDPTHTSKFTKEWLKKTKRGFWTVLVKALIWLLWKFCREILKLTVHTRKLTSILRPQAFWKRSTPSTVYTHYTCTSIDMFLLLNFWKSIFQYKVTFISRDS